LGHHAEPILDVLDILALRDQFHMKVLYRGCRVEQKAEFALPPSTLRRPAELNGFGDSSPRYGDRKPDAARMA
jgi:hypothetical protein